jgi:hypothetical protein
MVVAREACESAYSALEFANDCVQQTERILRYAQQSNDAKVTAVNIAKDAAEDAQKAAGALSLDVVLSMLERELRAHLSDVGSAKRWNISLSIFFSKHTHTLTHTQAMRRNLLDVLKHSIKLVLHEKMLF